MRSEKFAPRDSLPSNWILNQKYSGVSNSSMIKDVLNLINGSKEIVVVSSFFLAHGEIEQALVNAAMDNVRCYVMFATEVRLRQEGMSDEFMKKAYNKHIETLRKLSGIVLIRASTNFHAKIILSDPYTAPRGMLLTANLTEEALGRNQELAVHLTENEIVESMKVIRWAFWEYAEHEVLDNKGNVLPCRPLGKTKEYKCSSNVLQTTPNYKTIKDELMNSINHTKSIIISSYGWDKENPLVKKLCDLAKQGISVTVLTRPRAQHTKLFIQMKTAGIRILGFKWLHAKAIITDSQTIVMSANIEKNGLYNGFELGIKLDDTRADKIQNILKHWIENHQYEFTLPDKKESPIINNEKFSKK